MAKTETTGRFHQPAFRWLGALTSRKNKTRDGGVSSQSPAASDDSYDFTQTTRQPSEHLMVSSASSTASSRTVSTASSSGRGSDESLPTSESAHGHHHHQPLDLRRLLRDVTGRDSAAKWTSDHQVERHFTRIGWRVVPIQPDGNCLFRAISDQLYQNEDFHRDIRQRVVDYIKREGAQFRPFLGNRGHTADEAIGIYCKRMSRDGEWGGNPELYAVAAMFNVRIVLHQGPARRLCIEPANATPEKRSKKKPIPASHRTLNLLFKDDHYSSVVTSDEPSKQQHPFYEAQPDPESECAAPEQQIEQEQPSTLLDLAVRSQMAPICIETIHIPDYEVIKPKRVWFRPRRPTSVASSSSVMTPADEPESPSPAAAAEALSPCKPIVVVYPRRTSFRRGQLLKTA